jgi:hypothetical protein
VSRESRLKATIGAINPRGVDLTELAPARSVSRAAPIQRIGMDMAAGALAFTSLDRFEDGDGNPVASDDPAAIRRPGDPFTPMLLRLKYGRHIQPALFTQAKRLLVHRHAGLDQAGGAVLEAVAAAALFEWLNDECSRCRGASAMKVRPCPARCDRGYFGFAGLREPMRGRRRSRRTARDLILEQAMMLGAMRGEAWFGVKGMMCATCRTTGFVVVKPRDVRGMLCTSCGNSGQQDWSPKRRWLLVAHHIKLANAQPLTYPAFLQGWNRKYWRFIGVLRAADRAVGVGLDLGLFASTGRDIDMGGGRGRISSIEPGREEKQDDCAPVEPSGAVGQSAEESPQQPTGPVPSKDS